MNLSTKLFNGDFRYLVNDDTWKERLPRDSRSFRSHCHTVVGRSESADIEWIRFMCVGSCLFCSAVDLGMDICDALDAAYKDNAWQVHTRETIIANWRNGLDADGQPFETDLKPAKIVT